ncbi:MAG: pectin esterase [Bacteroidales bacterium]|nr:pectin esterase [Bacteroidales bacterium]
MKTLMLNVLLLLAGCLSLPARGLYDYTVATDGTGDFTSVQAAIDACKSFPDKRVRVFIKNGIYREKIKVPACNTHLSLIGESAEHTIITWDDFFDRVNRGRNSTFYTYTLIVEADDFRAENLTIENSAGRVGQAVALHVEGDRCVIINCRLLGNQDTLYTGGQNSRQYYKNCYIAGTTDFIFGAATALFDSCTIHSKSNSYITAASTIKGKLYGYVFTNCLLEADPGVDSVYLGRPWRDYARVVFLNCEMGAHIVPEGWANWDKTARHKTAYYAEYRNTGSGSHIGRRVTWSHQLTAGEAAIYSREKVLAPVRPVEPEVDPESAFRIQQ